MLTGANTALTSLSVLIVEDEALIALNLITLLEDLGHHVHGPAATSAQALALAAASRPDLAFIDMNLFDGATGADLAHQLARNPLTTVVVLSATPDGVQEGTDGIFRVIRKPYRDQAILEVVTRALAHRDVAMAENRDDDHQEAHASTQR
jgi:DNA-binding NtrC family response regulator